MDSHRPGSDRTTSWLSSGCNEQPDDRRRDQRREEQLHAEPRAHLLRHLPDRALDSVVVALRPSLLQLVEEPERLEEVGDLVP